MAASTSAALVKASASSTHDGERVRILSGVDDGTRVALALGDSVADGKHVQPVATRPRTDPPPSHWRGTAARSTTARAEWMQDSGGSTADGTARPGAAAIPEATWLESLQRALLYRSRTLELLRGLSQRYGAVALMRTGFFPPLISLFGPDANRFVLLDQEQQLSAKRAWDFIMGRIFPNGLLLRDGADHRHHRVSCRSRSTTRRCASTSPA
jgi:hypothetical protein